MKFRREAAFGSDAFNVAVGRGGGRVGTVVRGGARGRGVGAAGGARVGGGCCGCGAGSG